MAKILINIMNFVIKFKKKKKDKAAYKTKNLNMVHEKLPEFYHEHSIIAMIGLIATTITTTMFFITAMINWIRNVMCFFLFTIIH